MARKRLKSLLLKVVVGFCYLLHGYSQATHGGRFFGFVAMLVDAECKTTALRVLHDSCQTVEPVVTHRAPPDPLLS